jgi:hypothetical protein
VPAVFTVRYRPVPSENNRSPLEDFARRTGAAIAWQHHDGLNRSYALVEGADPAVTLSLSKGEGAIVFASPIIALAIRPNVAEALPALEAALGGNGHPAGVVGFELADGAAIIEWNLDVTPAQLILALVDIELKRFHAARTSELLTPLPLRWWTALASAGLEAPEIAPDRVLEALIEEQHVVP